MAFYKSSRRLRIKQGIKKKVSGTDSDRVYLYSKVNTGIMLSLLMILKSDFGTCNASKELGAKANTKVSFRRR